MVSVKLGPNEVGDGHPCYVIAEAGANHDRDLDVARRLIDVAAEAGADAVKFQTYSGPHAVLHEDAALRLPRRARRQARARAARRHRAAARVAADPRRALPRRGHRVPLQPVRPRRGRRARRARRRRVQDRVVRARRHPAHRVHREQGPAADPVDGHGDARRDRRRGRGRPRGRRAPRSACSSARRCTRRPRTS